MEPEPEPEIEMARCLIEAAKGGNVDHVLNLLAAGYDVDWHNENGETALMWASAYGKREVVDVLIEAGCDVDAQNNKGFRAVMDAALGAKFSCLRLLMAAGCSIDGRGGHGDVTALMCAVQSFDDSPEQESVACMAMLLAAGCGLDEVDEAGDTAMDMAQAGSVGFVGAMIQAERDRRAIDGAVGKHGARAGSLRV